MILTPTIKKVIVIASFVFSPFLITLVGAGGGTASAQIVNYADATWAISNNCTTNGNLLMAHAAYGSATNLNDATGVVTYDLNVLWQRCRGGNVGEYAITGYNGDACPVVGMYHNGSDGTRDCVKYSNRHNGMPPCGSFRCIIPWVWNGYAIYAGPDGEPGDYGLRSKGLGGRTVAISGWASKTLNSGSENVYVSTLCDYYSGVSNRLCQDTYVHVSWVRSNYTLTPTVTLTPSQGSPGTPINLEPAVNNTGTTNSDTAQWQLTKFKVAPSRDIPHNTGGYSTVDVGPLTYFADNGGNPNAIATNLTTVSSGPGVFGPGITNSGNYPPYDVTGEIIPDEPVGTRICYALSVQPRANGTDEWNHSEPRCVVVAKAPKVQVLGGDLIVGRATPYNPIAPDSNVITSTSYSATTGKYYGSWSEYAIIASGTVRNMASAAQYAGGASTGDICSLSLLTLGNKASGTCPAAAIGGYKTGRAVPNVATRFKVTNNISGPNADIRDLVSQGVYSVSGGNLNLTSTGLVASDGAGKGKWVVINDPEATVTIKSDINYTPGALTEIDDIPQVLIIAKNILIDPNVKNIDAWLVAAGAGSDGIINTCSSVTAGAPTSANLNNTTCTNKLTVNGPLLANHLYLYRTAGADTGSGIGSPAETFNLRADAYIWASAYSPGNGRIPTVSTKELPPRF